MSLEQKLKKIKFLNLSLLILILILFSTFLLGFYIKIKQSSLYNQNITLLKSDEVIDIRQKKVAFDKNKQKNFYIAASKSGSKYYYYGCSGLNRIKVQNLVYFNSEGQAEAKGYTLAQNCEKP